MRQAQFLCRRHPGKESARLSGRKYSDADGVDDLVPSTVLFGNLAGICEGLLRSVQA